MPSDFEQLRTIRSQALAAIAEITASPKPSYTIDGQSVSWNSHLRRLRQTVDWCDRKLAGEEPFEISSQAGT
ncbi:MAG: hypothetical protein PHN77_11070 [Thermoguttaceae bacterium]|jgi:hypothetical protein|nr:hypothetical protein [Thermoguttaceae bacterium]